jgi:hypothetical protein
MVVSKSMKNPSLLIRKRWKTVIEKLIIRTQIGSKSMVETARKRSSNYLPNEVQKTAFN